MILFSITENELELVKKTLKVLGKFSKFDILKIYESDNCFEISTSCHSENYTTRTRISKCSWRVKECYYQKSGEKEIKLK